MPCRHALRMMGVVMSCILLFVLLFPGGTAFGSPALPSETIGKDGAPMVLVPEGIFPMGVPKAARDGGVDERPNHDVFVDTFYIDKYEVTNGRYLEFITKTGHRTPQHPTDPTKGLWQREHHARINRGSSRD